jgi:hypothetical protein
MDCHEDLLLWEEEMRREPAVQFSRLEWVLIAGMSLVYVFLRGVRCC